MAIPFEKLGGGMSDSDSAILAIPVGGGMVRTPTPNILWGGQISVNPYFSRGFTHIYM